MRILADENVPRPIVAWLRETGHDVLYSAESREQNARRRSAGGSRGPRLYRVDRGQGLR